jgi:hypothetical protein
VNQGVLEVSDRMLYDVEKNRKPVPNGAVDPRLVSIYQLTDYNCSANIDSRVPRARPDDAKHAARD